MSCAVGIFLTASVASLAAAGMAQEGGRHADAALGSVRDG
jgi:hypothetical protein